MNTTAATTKVLARNHTPHPFDVALERAGSDGNMSAVYILRFVSCQIMVKKNKLTCPCLAMSQKKTYVVWRIAD